MSRRALSFVLVSLAMLTQASFVAAQPRSESAAQNANKPIQVSVRYSWNVPVTNSANDAKAAQMEEARRVLYKIAVNECDVLTNLIADTCSLDRLNVQSNLQSRHRMGEQISVNGNATYKITLK